MRRRATGCGHPRCTTRWSLRSPTLAPDEAGFLPAGPSLKDGGAGNAVERAALAELTHETGDVGWYDADLVNACLRADKARG